MEPIASFLPAILAAPDDDLPRLVCADWLEERGDPRGEFIRVQCRLANLGEGDADWPTLKAREHALRTRYERTWVAPLRGLVRAWEFRRGFVEQISIEAGTFVNRAAELFALAPVRHVHFLDAAPVMAQLAECPQLAHLNAIQLNSTYINDENVRQLAASPYLRQVAMLHLNDRAGFSCTLLEDCW